MRERGRRIYRPRPKGPPPARTTLRNPQPLVHRAPDGSLFIRWKGRELTFPAPVNRLLCPCWRAGLPKKGAPGWRDRTAKRFGLCAVCELESLGRVPPPVTVIRGKKRLAESRSFVQRQTKWNDRADLD